MRKETFKRVEVEADSGKRAWPQPFWLEPKIPPEIAGSYSGPMNTMCMEFLDKAIRLRRFSAGHVAMKSVNKGMITHEGNQEGQSGK
jgi:hypothetical protein